MLKKNGIVDIEPIWATLIDAEWMDELDSTAFLSRCREGVVSLMELKAFVLQHHYYSRNFTRYLCALLSNLGAEADRLSLAFNLFEELGLGTCGQVPHTQIYRSLMQLIGVKPGDAPVLPSTQFLIDRMFVSCREPDPLVGLGALCLGAEAIVPHIYSQVVQGFRAHGIAETTLEFFHIHIMGDDAHALTMKEIIEHELVVDATKAHVLQNSARKAIYARKVFFDGLK
jgi:pyrroloquinoline-quinone synthase